MFEWGSNHLDFPRLLRELQNSNSPKNEHCTLSIEGLIIVPWTILKTSISLVWFSRQIAKIIRSPVDQKGPTCGPDRKIDHLTGTLSSFCQTTADLLIEHQKLTLPLRSWKILSPFKFTFGSWSSLFSWLLYGQSKNYWYFSWFTGLDHSARDFRVAHELLLSYQLISGLVHWMKV